MQFYKVYAGDQCTNNNGVSIDLIYVQTSIYRYLKFDIIKKII